MGTCFLRFQSPSGQRCSSKDDKWISFITVSRSLNEQDFRKNLKFFQVPDANVEVIGSKLVKKIFDEYVKVDVSMSFTPDLFHLLSLYPMCCVK